MKAIVCRKKKNISENPMVYDALRSSIVSCEERIRSETINMYIIYFTMFSLGFTYNWLFMVSCIVLVSFQSMINSDRLSIEKASTYIRIFFEENRGDIHWESLHKDALHLSVYNAEIKNIGWYFDKYSSAILAVLSFFSLIISIFCTGIESEIRPEMIAQVTTTLVFVFIVVYLNCKFYINTGKQKDPISDSIQKFYSKCTTQIRPKKKVKTSISDIEYEKLVKRLEFHDTMRNNLLMFSFTAVLAILGVAIELELDVVSSWICLLPFLLIVPFSARISYYRLSSAHICAFLKTYAKERVMFEIGAEHAKEKFGINKGYKQLAFLVNHEMMLLGIVSSLVFYIKFIPCIDGQHWWYYIGYILPIALVMWVFAISHSTNKYDDIVERYKQRWEATK